MNSAYATYVETTYSSLQIILSNKLYNSVTCIYIISTHETQLTHYTHYFNVCFYHFFFPTECHNLCKIYLSYQLPKYTQFRASAGVLNDMGSFFDSLRDNLETLVSLSPQERSTLFQDPPSVVPAPAASKFSFFMF